MKARRLSYSRSPRFRSAVAAVLALMSVDLPLLVAVAVLLPGPWAWMVPGALGVVWLGSLASIAAQMRAAHRLDEQALHLRWMRWRLSIPRDRIARVTLLEETLPRPQGLGTIRYLPEYDALAVLADNRGVAMAELKSRERARLPSRVWAEFGRLILSLDDPHGLVAAFGDPEPETGGGVDTGAGIADIDAGAGGPCRDMEPAIDAPPAPVSALAQPPGDRPCGESGIILRDLRRRYGQFEAVHGLNLAVGYGEILALLGSNGAGKTTTIKMLAGLLRPTEGSVIIAGRDAWVDRSEARRRTGYVPDVPLLHEGLTAREFLWFVAGLYGLNARDSRQRTEDLLRYFGLDQPWGDHLVRHLSLGMRRKLAIAAALIHRPQVLLLDEVTNGLDPRAARDVKDLIVDMAAGGAAVLLATHVLDVAAELAHRIAILHHGMLRAVGTVHQLRHAAGLGQDASLEAAYLVLTQDGAGGGGPDAKRDEPLGHGLEVRSHGR